MDNAELIWNDAAESVAQLCGIYNEGDNYLSGISDDQKVVSIEDLIKGLKQIFTKPISLYE